MGTDEKFYIKIVTERTIRLQMRPERERESYGTCGAVMGTDEKCRLT